MIGNDVDTELFEKPLQPAKTQIFTFPVPTASRAK